VVGGGPGRGWGGFGVALALLLGSAGAGSASGPDAIERLWLAPSASLEQRVLLTRRAALERGVWNHDAAALAVLGSPGNPVERAEAAVALAPDLPVARMELAHALWRQGDSPLEALAAALRAAAAIPRHLEASLWALGSGLFVVAVALVAGGLACIGLVAVPAARHVAHDLGDVFSPRGASARGAMPGFARMGLLAALVLVPSLLGEGILGLALALFAVGFLHGGRAARVALVLAAASVLVGSWPAVQLAGAALGALAADPVARAALASDRGVALASDVALLEAAAADDPLAAEALARLARREGRLGRADALYQALHAQRPDDPVISNNAANVRLRLGHVESALTLYQTALSAGPDAVVLYNLSQAHGRAFQVEEMTRDLARAQEADGELAAELTRLQGAASDDFFVDLPIAPGPLRRRLLAAGSGDAFARAFRTPFAPGRLGTRPEIALGAFAAALVVAGALRGRLRPSRGCTRCGRCVCPRCHCGVARGGMCEGCTRLFLHPEQTDRNLRTERIRALERRRALLDRLAAAVAVVIPGAAGFVAGRPLRGLIGTVLFVLAAGAVVWRRGIVPDPLATGAAGPFAGLVLAALCAIAYLGLVTSTLAKRRSA
jgi:tetratricopeptide (TPR) repeat protein